MPEKPAKKDTITLVTNDASTTMQNVRDMVQEFVSQRQWEKFHSPKNITMALAIEAAELMEHFQWSTIEESRAITHDKEKLSAVGEELADVLCYGMALANTLGIDISETMRKKMQKNQAKYPVDEYLGKFE